MKMDMKIRKNVSIWNLRDKLPALPDCLQGHVYQWNGETVWSHHIQNLWGLVL